MLIGAAIYIDVLKSLSILSVCLQDDGLDIISGIKCILKSSKSLKALSEDPLQWPTYLKGTTRCIKVQCFMATL